MLTGMGDYMDKLKRMSYLELMKERERLLNLMHRYETDEISGAGRDPGRKSCPPADLRYQVFFDYLSVLCGVMRERYAREYARGRRTLKQDADAEAFRNGKYA